MGFFEDLMKEKVETKVVVEAFKGELDKASIVDAAKKIYAEDLENKVKEIVVLGDLEKVDPKFKNLIVEHFVEMKVTDLIVNYMAIVDQKGNLAKITAIISESVSEELLNLLNQSKQILRLQK